MYRNDRCSTLFDFDGRANFAGMTLICLFDSFVPTYKKNNKKKARSKQDMIKKKIIKKKARPKQDMIKKPASQKKASPKHEIIKKAVSQKKASLKHEIIKKIASQKKASPKHEIIINNNALYYTTISCITFNQLYQMSYNRWI